MNVRNNMDADGKIELLKKTLVFKSMPEEQLKEISDMAFLRTFQREMSSSIRTILVTFWV